MDQVCLLATDLEGLCCIIRGISRYLANPIPKITRPGKRKRVTLIAAVRYIDGVVICADSQETAGPYRVTVDKIKPRDCGNYELVVGGSGEIGALVDGQANAIERYISTWNAGDSEEDCRTQLEALLTQYTTDVVMCYPAELQEKILRFVVCLRDKANRSIYLWKTDGNTAEAVDDFVLVGWEERLYQHEAKRLFHKEMNRAQSTVMGLHLLSLGKATSSYIGDPFQAIIVSGGRTLVETQERVETIGKQIQRVNATLSKVIISAPNLELPDGELDKALKNFQEEVLGLRREVREHTLQISDSLHRHWGDHVSLSVGSVEPVFVPESPRQNPQPKKGKTPSKRKKP